MRFYFRSKIQRRIFSHIVAIIILCVLVSVASITYFVSKEYVSNKIDDSLDTAIKTKQNFEFVFETANELAYNISVNENLQMVTSKNVDSKEKASSISSLKQIIDNTIKFQKIYRNISIYFNDNSLFKDNPNVLVQEDILPQSMSLEDNSALSKELPNNSRNFYTSFEGDIFTVNRAIYSDDGSIRGVICIELDKRSIEEIFSSSSYEYSNEKIAIVDSTGDIILAFPNTSDLSDVLKDMPDIIKYNTYVSNHRVFGERSIIVSDSIKYTNWKIIRIISMNDIYGAVRQIIFSALIVLAGFVVIAVISSYYISKTITDPIIRLNKSMTGFKDGNMVESIVSTDDEIGELTRSFNEMEAQIRNNIRTIIESEKKKAELQLEILQEQINPHFLYNTLDSIRWIAIIHNQPNISDMVLAIINLLRYNISKKGQFVTVNEEIKCVANYVKIQRYRFGKEIRVEYNIDSVGEYRILKFMLQPLIENSIFHGFNNLEFPSLIKILGYVEEDNLIIKVIDNGVSTENKEQIDIKSRMHTGIGIENIRERIKLHFGTQYDITLTRLEQGMEVKIVLPIIEEVGEEE